MRLALIDFQSNRREALKQAFTAGGFDVSSWAESAENLYDFMQRVKPEAIIVDVDSPSRDTVEHMSFLEQENPKPMIMLAERNDMEAVTLAMKSGFGVYVVKDVSADLAKSMVHMAVANFDSQQALRGELEKTRQELKNCEIVAQAKSLLIEHAGMSEATAYDHIRLKAMRDRVTKASIAADIIKLVKEQAAVAT